MGSQSKGHQPKEIKERMQYEQKRAAIQQAVITMGIGQATAISEKALKMFAKTKTEKGMPEDVVISWCIEGCINTLADLCAYSIASKYIEDPQELLQACADSLIERTVSILEDHKEKEKNKSDIIIPGQDIV